MDDRIKELNIPRGILIHEFSEITGISVEMLRDWHKKQILTASVYMLRLLNGNRLQ